MHLENADTNKKINFWRYEDNFGFLGLGVVTLFNCLAIHTELRNEEAN